MLDSFPPRIDIPIFYEDAQGQQQQKRGKHVMLLPHEVVGAFYRFAPVDLMTRLVGGPGVSWILIIAVYKSETLLQIKQDPYNQSLNKALSEFWSHETGTQNLGRRFCACCPTLICFRWVVSKLRMLSGLNWES